MTADQIQEILIEFRNEKHIPLQVTNEHLLVFFKQASYFLNGLVEGLDIDFSVDFDARKLLKIHMWYDYYGAIDDFKKRYVGDIYATQIKYIF